MAFSNRLSAVSPESVVVDRTFATATRPTDG